MSDPVAGAHDWLAARVMERREETPRAATLRLAVDGWRGHVAGQRVDVRLTADDGYQATRQYSIASAPSSGALELTVERLDDGEVSPYLVDVAEVGDAMDIRGPIGGWFTWRPGDPRPLLLVGGGSGIVPLMAMAREAVLTGGEAVDVRLLVSTRTPADLLYASELEALHDAGRITLLHTVTRDPTGARSGRIDAQLVGELLRGVAPEAIFACGSTGFVEAASDLLLAAGVPASAIRTERFGPSA